MHPIALQPRVPQSLRARVPQSLRPGVPQVRKNLLIWFGWHVATLGALLRSQPFTPLSSPTLPLAALHSR